VEAKCPYTQRNVTPIETCSSPSFCYNVQSNGSKQRISLRREYPYFCKAHGQMVIGQRPWHDFVVSTTKGTEIQRINFILGKQASTCINIILVVPEIVSPMYTIGKPIRKYSHT